MAPTVHEVTTTTLRIIRIEVRDPPIVKGEIVELETADAGAYGVWLDRNSRKAAVIGSDKKFLKYEDVRATEYLDRAASADHTGYAVTGRTVEAVYVKRFPYDSGECAGATNLFTTKALSFKHFLWLELDADLVSGTTYTIEFPAGTGLSDYTFVFDDKLTRCSSIQANQVGHRPSDEGKNAYLGAWIPGYGTHGEVDILTEHPSITDFHIIDYAGNIVFTEEIVLRLGPTDNEPSNNTEFFASTVSPRRQITNIVKTSSTVVTVTYTGDDPANGAKIFINQVGGMTQINQNVPSSGNPGTERTVANVNTGAKTFELTTANNTSWGAYTSGGYWYPTTGYHLTGTYTFGLDYSAFEPAEQGFYRIYIPGLGVSDYIQLDNAVWKKVVDAFGAGIFFQRHGIEIDNRFGYSRPQSPRAGMTIYKSNLPAMRWASELRGVIPTPNGGNANWTTATLLATRGAHHDAGDWDSFSEHSISFYYLLDAWECLPSNVKNAQWGIPKSSQVLDPVLYAGTDSLGDLIHEGCWFYDFYRRTQNPDGSIIGGLTMSGVNTFNPEPSYLNRSTWYCYAPDHVSTFRYVVGAAKLAIILNQAGFTALSDVYEASAIAAWNWAEAIYSDETTRNNYYATAKSIAETHEGWQTSATVYCPALSANATTYDCVMANMASEALGNRAAAASTLFRLTGGSTYKSIAEAYTPSGYSGIGAVFAWEYCKNEQPNVDVSLRTTRRNQLYAEGTGWCDLHHKAYIDETCSYRLLKYKTDSIGFGRHGTGLQDAGLNCLRAWHMTGNAKYIRWIQEGMTHLLGGNQVGMSLVTGLGRRYTSQILHRDYNWGGGGKPVPQGITTYAWVLHNMVTDQLQFQSARDKWTAPQDIDPATNASDFKPNHEIVPWNLAIPTYEQYYENPGFVEIMEYTITQSQIPMLICALAAHGNDGNTQDSLTPAKRRLIVNVV